MSQIHNRFKVFAGDPAEDHGIGNLGNQIEQFVEASKIAPKSIGVEYLEHSKRLIMTLGYADDQPAVLVRIACVNLGKVNTTDSDFSALEQAMMQEAEHQQNVICHELYITDEDEFFMVFMCQK